MENKLPVDTIVFDFNGTIVDDRDVCLELLNDALIEKGHLPITLDRYLSIFTFPIIDYYRKAGFRFAPEGEDDFVELAHSFDRHYLARFPEIKPFDDILPTLKRYQGKKRLIVLSATEQGNLEKELRLLGLDSYFDAVIGIKTIFAPSKVQEAKDFFSSHAFNPKTTVFIGDTLHDEEVATILKAHSILVTRGHQSETVIRAGKSEWVAPSLKACWDLLD